MRVSARTTPVNGTDCSIEVSKRVAIDSIVVIAIAFTITAILDNLHFNGEVRGIVACQ